MRRPTAVDCLAVGGQFRCFLVAVRSGAAGKCCVRGRKPGVGVEAWDYVREFAAECVDKTQ